MAYKQILSTISNTNVVWLYCTDVVEGNTLVKRVQDETGSIITSTVGSLSTTGRLSYAPWENRIYFSNKDTQLKRIKGKSITDVLTSDTYASGTKLPVGVGEIGYREVCAKYLVGSDDHLMMANLKVDGNDSPLMLVWSDLYNPDLFVVDSSTEAGYYDMPPQGGEIMGLAYCRGYTLILTRKQIKAARYIGYSSGIYEFMEISNSVGCRYHYSVISAKDIVFFIGYDNFYAIDANELQPIGDGVWKFFQDTIYSLNEEVPAFFDEEAEVVYWKYKANGVNGTTSGNYYDLLYNYKEQKWALRDSEGILQSWRTSSTVVTAITCDELNVPCSYYTGSVTPQRCSDFVRLFSFTSLFLTADTFLVESETSKDGVDESGRTVFIETKDMTFTVSDTAVRLSSIRLLCAHQGMLGDATTESGAYVEISVGYKNNLANEFAWTNYVRVANNAFEEREVNFRFRKYNIAGKIFRLRIRALQAGASFLKSISSCQITVDIPDEQSASYVTR
jgi:hypothetical protein